MIKNYHLFSFLKKIISMIAIVLLSEGSQLVTLFIVHLLQLLLTLIIRPYLSLIVNVLKILGDISILLFFISLMLLKQSYSEIIDSSNVVISSDMMNKLRSTEIFSIVTIVLFNTLHVMIMIFNIVTYFITKAS